VLHTAVTYVPEIWEVRI